ncbi:MAG: YihY family inner membrane protein [Gammaproteobacteria bacterium]|uniref:YihY family inner membrane protein n=1 Tax=Rhodoferax sp. TaxID=50421 RepID=UPI0017952FB7|nr:YihY family inner membrane protein [Rhodoferax sp.]MBU3900039.1 YihY family inner membrane protein [Gammaproteobacteria bacterium]MBA3059714.1 YihY family inner membrane protein [Rhodoferax sp.]MBU3999403.1 YihY family inner membrane protein [Gammaproteobacteria bacterium]MBU4082077.1 YihY family inner membrane protein [Gammaproteobacteria bacterium]MBU4113872.1 YihY family inner membrane protein [Gammaproteobacteria bacterium]
MPLPHCTPPPPSWSQRLEVLLRDLSNFPWKSTARTLRARFSEDRLGLTASSLTFTTTMALVPFVTVALAVFTAFPMFAQLQSVVQQWLVKSLIPDNIARQVLGYLTQFAGQASKLGGAGIALLLVTAVALILTIDHTLNSIWRVRTRRPLGQRVLVYWAALTLGPLLLGLSLSITSYAISASKGVVGVMPGGVQLLLDALQFFLVAWGMAALYHFVPNTWVKWSHAWAGGLFVSAGIELAKKLLALYLSQVPTYSVLYGAFATVPILLIWIYVAWVIVLLGAVIAAYLPSLLSGIQHRGHAHGLQFQLALETLQQLDRVRVMDVKGLTTDQLAALLRVDALQLEPVLETLSELDWIGLLDEEFKGDAARYVMLANPDSTALAPLLDALLLHQEQSTQNLWENGRWPTLLLREAL